MSVTNATEMTIEFPKGFVRTKVRVELAELVRDIGPIPGHDLIQLTGRYRAVISRALYDLRDANLVYIKEWTHPGDSNTLAPVWAWRTNQHQRDAKRPEPMSRTEVNVRWNRRHAAYRSAVQKAKRGTKINIWAGLL